MRKSRTGPISDDVYKLEELGQLQVSIYSTVSMQRICSQRRVAGWPTGFGSAVDTGVVLKLHGNEEKMTGGKVKIHPSDRKLLILSTSMYT